jgi:succinate dehydrogenase/fumarate reductase flavoprotein subunit
MSKDAPGSKKSATHLPGSLTPKTWYDSEKHAEKTKVKPAEAAVHEKLGEIMWRQVGVMRNGQELKAAIEALSEMHLPQSDKEVRGEHELRSLHTLGLLVAKSALARQESRGSHYRADYPYRDDDQFQRHSLVAKGQDVSFEKKPGLTAGVS